MENLDRELIQILKRELYLSINHSPNYYWIASVSMEVIRNIHYWQKSHRVLGNEVNSDFLSTLAQKSYYKKYLTPQDRFFYFKEVHNLEKKLYLLDKFYQVNSIRSVG